MCYYFCAETWFAILFTVIVEISAPEVSKQLVIVAFAFTAPVETSFQCLIADKNALLYPLVPGFCPVSLLSQRAGIFFAPNDNRSGTMGQSSADKSLDF